MTWKPTESAIDRFNRKLAAGQAVVTVADVEQRTFLLTYWRFDSDSGQRTEDEVDTVRRNEIAAERDTLTEQMNALTARVNLLNAVVAYLDGLMPD